MKALIISANNFEESELLVPLVTSRQPADLHAFMRETMKQIGL